ncbi:MAG TPA: rod shape-determining protein MreC [Solirubrobacteraceae bacterium]|nr:rod shape-determining protein MreC [Solirubrobacteraceae bacterium]
MYDKKVRRRRAVLVSLVGLSLLLLTAYFGESAGGPLRAIQRGVLEVLAPLEDGASRALKPARDLFGWFGDTLHAKKERNALRKENAQLRMEAIGKQVEDRQIAELKSMVALDQKNGLAAYKAKAARVIARSPTVWYATINVDKGSNDGVHVNDPVVTGDGVVGKITSVTGDASLVTLVTDQSSGISAQVPNTGVSGIVEPAVGNPNDLLLDFVSRSSRIHAGQPVVTAGSRSGRLESLFPPDIPIGVVTKVDQQEVSLYQRVHIRPYADVRRFTFVQVLTRPKAPPSLVARNQSGPARAGKPSAQLP